MGHGKHPVCTDLQVSGAKLIHGNIEFFLPVSDEERRAVRISFTAVHEMYRSVYEIISEVRELLCDSSHVTTEVCL